MLHGAQTPSCPCASWSKTGELGLVMIRRARGSPSLLEQEAKRSCSLEMALGCTNTAEGVLGGVVLEMKQKAPPLSAQTSV